MITLFPESYAHAAWFLRCEVAAIMAVAEVESNGRGFDAAGRPVILYEPHYFSRLTGGKFDRSHPTLSYPKWKAGGYGKDSEQWPKLEAAKKLDLLAALQSCSWGLFQIMGTHYRRAGFASVQDMVTAAHRDADEHLRMFVWFIATDPALTAALRDLSYPPPGVTRENAAARFAKAYNGSGYAANKYDERIAAAYARLAK